MDRSLFYKKFPRFDWKFYTTSYKDLIDHGINTEDKAIRHYVVNGQYESRRTHVVVHYEKNQTIVPIPFENIAKWSKKIYVSSGLSMFETRVSAKYNLTIVSHSSEHATVTVVDVDDSCFFFGVYTNLDLELLNNYNGIKLIIWGGEDVNPNNLHSLKTIGEVKRLPNVIHIAISKCIYKRLSDMQISCILSEFNLVDTSLFYYNPKVVRGKNILIVNGQSRNRDHIYGKNVYDQVILRLPYYHFLFTNTLKKSYEEMPEIYNSCFIVLRLTKYDGNANTVQECSAMNVPIIHNQSEYGIKWSSVEDIVQIILLHYTNFELNS